MMQMKMKPNTKQNQQKNTYTKTRLQRQPRSLQPQQRWQQQPNPLQRRVRRLYVQGFAVVTRQEKVVAKFASAVTSAPRLNVWATAMQKQTHRLTDVLDAYVPPEENVRFNVIFLFLKSYKHFKIYLKLIILKYLYQWLCFLKP